MFQSMEKALISAKLYTLPVVFVKPDVDKGVQQKVKEIVRKRNGQVVETEETATHIIFGSVDPLKEEYGRPVIKRDKMIMMHWYYFPNSFDTWVNLETAGLEGLSIESTPSPHSGPWRVSSTWVYDTDQYNEWMSEEDYEVDENGVKKVHPRLMSVEDLMNPSEDRNKKNKGGKRKRSPSPPSKVGKRKSGRSPAVGKKTKPEDPESEDTTRDMEEPTPEPNIIEVPPTPPSSQATPKKDHELQPLKGGSITDLSEEPEERVGGGEDSQTGKTSDTNTQDDGQEDNVTEQTHHIIIPSYSAWFDYNSIHEVEKRAMPEFFNGRNKSKTPEIYLAYRYK